MIQRGIVLFLLSVLTVITQVFAGSLTNDPFVQSSIDRSNFEPGGQYHLFGAPRGGTTDREGRINVLPVYDQQFGSLRLENVVVDGDITYNTRFSGHHWDEHAPFSETSSQSKSTEEGSIADGFTVLKLNWSGTKVHPADGYDGEQGGGYPVPTGARDEYHYTINGNAQRISLQLNDQRSTSQRFLDRFSQAGKDFV
ncbi:MafB family polymorphic toxin, partial [Acinetobacter sp. SCC474]